MEVVVVVAPDAVAVAAVVAVEGRLYPRGEQPG